MPPNPCTVRVYTYIRGVFLISFKRITVIKVSVSKVSLWKKCNNVLNASLPTHVANPTILMLLTITCLNIIFTLEYILTYAKRFICNFNSTPILQRSSIKDNERCFHTVCFVYIAVISYNKCDVLALWLLLCKCYS